MASQEWRDTSPATRLLTRMKTSGFGAGLRLVRQQPELVSNDASAEDASVIEGTVIKVIAAPEFTTEPDLTITVPMTREQVYAVLSRKEVICLLELLKTEKISSAIKSLARNRELLSVKDGLLEQNPHLAVLKDEKTYNQIIEALLFMQEHEISVSPRASGSKAQSEMHKALLLVRNLRVEADTKSTEYLLNNSSAHIFNSEAVVWSTVMRFAANP